MDGESWLPLRETCSRTFFGDEEGVLQPLVGGKPICLGCARACGGGFGGGYNANGRGRCECGHACMFVEAKGTWKEEADAARDAYRRLFQVNVGQHRIKGSVDSHVALATRFDDADGIGLAMSLVPEDIMGLAFPAQGERDDDQVCRRLLAWFKTFFRWQGQEEPCTCGHTAKVSGATAPTAEERAHGAGLVEVFVCPNMACAKVSRFPRFNDPAKLLITRRGRCGEYAQTFCLILRCVERRRGGGAWCQRSLCFLLLFLLSQSSLVEL